MSLILGGYGTRQTRSLSSLTALKKMGSDLARSGTSMLASSMGAVGMLETALGVRFDAVPQYLFFVELSGVLVALFTECSGLEVTRKVDDVAEGGVNHYVHKLPGRIEQSNITLKRGMSLSRALWEWFSVGMYDFNVQRINFSIIQGAPGYNLATAIAGAAGANSNSALFQGLGKGFGKAKHWNVEDAFPIKWKSDELNTSSDKIALEEIEIAHHGLTLSYEVGTPLNPLASAVSLATSAMAAGEEKPEIPSWAASGDQEAPIQDDLSAYAPEEEEAP